MSRAVRKRCPVGVPADCEWCYEQRGKVWHLLSPGTGRSVDEFMDERSVRDDAEVRLGECMNARGGSGVGNITWGRGKFTWGSEEGK